MSNGGIWGSSQLPNPMEQVFNAMTWDINMKMRVQSQMNDILREADPAKFIAYKNQEEQVKRLGEIEQEVVNLARKRNGRFTPQDMMDVNFLVNEFETWQNNTLGKQDMFAREYQSGLSNLNEIEVNDFIAGMQLYMEDPDKWTPGGMIKPRAVNPVNYFTNYRIPGRTDPLQTLTPRIFEESGFMYEELTDINATPEEKEAIVLSEYINNPGIKAGIDKFWDESISVEEQQNWVDQMTKYNSSQSGSKNPIKNPELYMGMKMFSPLIMKNTKRTRRIGQVTPAETEEERREKVEAKFEKSPHITVANEGSPVEFNRQMYIGNSLQDANYGNFTEFIINNIPANTEITLDETTFITSIPLSDEYPADNMGLPASEFETKDKKSLRGQAKKLLDARIYNDMPVYVGTGETIEDVPFGEERLIRGRKKGDVVLYKNQPMPESLISEIESIVGEKWLEDNIEYKPVAIMQLETGVRETLEVMKVFDENLAKRFKLVNPELVLKQKLDKENLIYLTPDGKEFKRSDLNITDEQIEALIKDNKLRKK